MMAVWKDMDSAPLDGREIQVEIPGHGSDNVIAWVDGLLATDGSDAGCWAFARDQEPPDCWTDGYCWEVNEDFNKSIQPTKWKELP